MANGKSKTTIKGAEAKLRAALQKQGPKGKGAEAKTSAGAGRVVRPMGPCGQVADRFVTIDNAAFEIEAWMGANAPFLKLVEQADPGLVAATKKAITDLAKLCPKGDDQGDKIGGVPGRWDALDIKGLGRPAASGGKGKTPAPAPAPSGNGLAVGSTVRVRSKNLAEYQEAGFTNKQVGRMTVSKIGKETVTCSDGKTTIGKFPVAHVEVVK